MVNKVEPVAPVQPVSKVLLEWMEAGQTLLDNLSAIITPTSTGKEKRSSEIAQKLLAASLSPKTLKNFHDHSVQLLSSLQKVLPKEEAIQAKPQKAAVSLMGTEKGQKAALSQATVANLSSSQEKEAKNLKSEPSAAAPRMPKSSDLLHTLPLRVPTVSQETQKIIREVLQSLDLLSSVPTEEKARLRQLQTAYHRIKTVIDHLVKPIQGSFESDFASARDPARPSLKAAVKKPVARESLPLPSFPHSSAEKQTFEGQKVQSKTEDASSASTHVKSPPEKLQAISQHLLAFSKKESANPPPQPSEKTVLPAAPFIPAMQTTSSKRKEKKRRKFSWEREEYDEEDFPPKR